MKLDKVLLVVSLLSLTTGKVLGQNEIIFTYQKQTVETQEGENQTESTYNPCIDEKYLILKQKNLDDMTDREYEYFLMKEKECYEFRQSAQLDTKKQSTTRLQPKRKPIYQTKSNRFDISNSSVRVGIDIGGNFTMSYEGEEVDDEPEIGFTGAAERTFYSTNDLNLGVGIEYQFLRKLKDSGKFNFESIYGIITSKIAPNFILIGRLGYGFYDGDSKHTEYALADVLEGGLYYSIGAILVLADNLGVDVSYSVNKGIYPYYESFLIDWDYYTIDADFDVTYSRINISTIVGF
ncbi:MAG: hypothetical protein SCARUB_05025 [Candidatus Scalindua rubra]|uniref:Outer membrane protein beta-barrel domain-containing protein n=1 Tax=Candidatus Scalindua rubra TaxID=1872076 RepID=A0A1E3X4H6_9BACT|nr:MAG: hypothetical protein SCARUB_05025 [Candidatus Scalindua rubra]